MYFKSSDKIGNVLQVTKFRKCTLQKIKFSNRFKKIHYLELLKKTQDKLVTTKSLYGINKCIKAATLIYTSARLPKFP